MSKVSPPNFVGKQARKSYTSVLKVSLPSKGYILGRHLLEILGYRPFSTRTGMSKILKEQQKSARKERIRFTLETLKKIDCYQNYKIIISPSAHKCINRVYTHEFFVETDSIQKFLKTVEEQPSLSRGKKTESGFVVEKIKPSFECTKCKKTIPYEEGKEYKIKNYEYLTLSSRGILVMLSFPESKLSNFDKFYKREELFYLLDVLDKNQKKTHVKLFLSKLSNGAQNIEELIKIHNKWLKQTKYDITQMKINKLRQKRLFSLQSQFINEAIRKQIKVKK